MFRVKLSVVCNLDTNNAWAMHMLKQFKPHKYIRRIWRSKNPCFTTMSSLPLARFIEAMSGVYGPLPSGDPSTWEPPPKAGGFKGRYLWTDAFGVINFLTLHKETGDGKYLILAKNLVRKVHDIQGRTRDGKTRLPGATEENPLGGGLRIGKEEAAGSDGDGQYHHYLTLWMFALNRLSIAAKDPSYNAQAISLAKAIHPRFFKGRSSSQPRMVWKISVDMSKALVNAEGNLDPSKLVL
jgi:hypothetical protein